MSSGLFQSDLQIPRRHVVVFCDDAFGPQSDRWVDLLPKGCHRILPVFDGGFDAAHPTCRPRVEAFFDAHPSRFERAPSLVVPGGEVAKNDPRVVESVLSSIHAENICRQSFVAIFGGGAVLDAVGFAASIAHRGVKVLRFPTTTLAQDDAGIGVKNGVNHHNEKNWQGVFAVPTAVINDFSLLSSLSDRDWRSGFSEAVKVALLKDAGEFERLEQHAGAIARRAEAESQRAIIRSAELHWRHIVEGGDPFEDEIARPLDYGHWSAHRLERLTDGALKHGEAVAIGLGIDAALAVELGRSTSDFQRRVLSVLHHFGFTLDHAQLDDPRALFVGIEQFRAHLGGALTLTLVAEPGVPFDIHDADFALISGAIERHRSMVRTLLA